MNKIEKFDRNKLTNDNRFIIYITGPSYLDVFDLLSINYMWRNRNRILFKLNE
jgi:hypothetical protein